jgi:hypothetical protein
MPLLRPPERGATCGRRLGCQCQVNPTRAKQTAYASPGDTARASAVEDAVEPLPLNARLSPEITAQWHPTLNSPRDVATVSSGSRKTFWWREPSCGHEWAATPSERQKRQRLRCPECRTILDSLAYHFPTIAAEWAPENPTTAWHVRPSGATPFTPAWICSTDPTHRWEASVASRTAGSDCPECRVPGKSKVELLHFDAAQEMFGAASSGRSLHSNAFVRRTSWLVDIMVPLAGGQELVIEYDGAYWHAGEEKTAIDVEKSLDLIADGYLVVRLRESPLPPLPIVASNYAEFVVSSTAPSPTAVIGHVHAWTQTVTRTAPTRG